MALSRSLLMISLIITMMAIIQNTPKGITWTVYIMMGALFILYMAFYFDERGL